MKRVFVGGIEFTLLDDDEVDCEHEWEDTFDSFPVNPGGEFVEGYGHHLVSVRIEGGRQCVKCGFRERGHRHIGESRQGTELDTGRSR